MLSIKNFKSIDFKKLIVPVVVMLAFWILAASIWLSTGEIMALFFFGYILQNQGVLSTECSLCQACITVCAKDALKLSFGFDLGGVNMLREHQLAYAGKKA